MDKHDEHCACGVHNHGCDHQEHIEQCGCEQTQENDDPCNCGQPHENDGHCGCEQPHEHYENCGCGQPHEHDENCGCGHDHAPIATPEGLSALQVDFLMELRHRQCLPVACFTLAKADDAARHGVALAPVYLSAPGDSMEQVKMLGIELSLLENMDLISLDYDIPLQNYPYDEYKTSALYTFFVKTVAEAATRPDCTFDTPALELGSMVLTQAGEEMVDLLLK